jgi:hypothetical protein
MARLIDYSLYSHDLVLAVGWVVSTLRGWLGWPCSGFILFFSLGGANSFTCLLSAGHLRWSDIIGLFLSLICYQLTVRCVFLAGLLFLHNFTIYFGQFVSLRPFSICNAEAILLIWQVLISFVLIIYGGRTCLRCKGGLVFVFYLLLYGLLSYWPSRPYPARLALYFLVLLRSHLLSLALLLGFF